MQPISIAVTSFNRYTSTIHSFIKVIDDPRVDEIVIVDDASTDGSGKALARSFFDHPKVKVIIQAENRTMQLNKADAISFCKNDWVLILDSDNDLDEGYLNALYRVGSLDEDTIYAPSKALPVFEYDAFEGMTISKENVRHFVRVPLFGCLINTCNYVCNKTFYLNVFQFNDKIKGVDTANHFFNHMVAGGKFYVVPNMSYNHAISKDSEFMKEADYNMACAAEIDKKLLAL